MHSSAAKFILSAILTEYRDFKRSLGDDGLSAERCAGALALALALERRFALERLSRNRNDGVGLPILISDAYCLKKYKVFSFIKFIL